MNSRLLTFSFAGVALMAYTGTVMAASPVPKMPLPSAGTPVILLSSTPKLALAGKECRLSGGVQIRAGGETVSSDSVVFSPEAHTMTFCGNVTVTTVGGVTMRAQTLVLRLPVAGSRAPSLPAIQKPR